MKLLVTLLFVLLLQLQTSALTLPAVLSSHMVLQQKTDARLWGWGDPGEKIRVTTSWNTQADSVVVNGNGKWEFRIATPVAGGPYQITLQGYNTVVLDDVLIGEVWICSGQSNMEYNYYWGLPQMREDLPAAANSRIRFFNIPRTTAEAPQENVRAQWSLCDSTTVKHFSAVGYYFGRKLNQDLNIPIGLVSASWSGTPAEVWVPAEEVNEDSVLKNAARQISPSNGWPTTPGYTFNGMIAPLLKFPITGAIWYQGETNTGTAATYQQLLETMIAAWRKGWNRELSFYLVQLAPFHYGNKNIAALLREAQAKTTEVKNTGMVITTDLADDTLDIHPKNKRAVGLRLANLALSDHYGATTSVTKSPVFKNMTAAKNQLVLFFDNAPNGLISKGGKVQGLFVAGADGRFYPAQARLSKNNIVVWSPEVIQPVAVRYAFSNTGIGNLFSKEGMPVAPFRTDAWPVDTSKE